jgi:hypothetical protein
VPVDLDGAAADVLSVDRASGSLMVSGSDSKLRIAVA